MRKPSVSLVRRWAAALAGIALWSVLASETRAGHNSHGQAHANASNVTNVNINIGFDAGMRQVGCCVPCGDNPAGKDRQVVAQPPMNNPGNAQPRLPHPEGRGKKSDPGQVGAKLGGKGKSGPAGKAPNTGPADGKLGGKGGSGGNEAKMRAIPMGPQTNNNKGGGNKGNLPPVLVKQPGLRNMASMMGGGHAGGLVGKKGGGKPGKK